MQVLNTFAAYVTRHVRVARLMLVAGAVLVGAASSWESFQNHIEDRLASLKVEAQRKSLELASVTVNGNLMGSVTVLGLIDKSIKQEASNSWISSDARILAVLQAVGEAFDAQGVFVVGNDGIVRTSWDRIGKPSTGLDVRFRPYFKSAIQGQSSVYAAVSMARGDRSLYFSAPIFRDEIRSASGLGVIVARTDLERVDKLLSSVPGRQALLLSPQGIVFAGSEPKWVGMIDGQPDAARLAEIRALKQFGPMFEGDARPAVLPLEARDGLQQMADARMAVATAAVTWGDPAGDWTLLLTETIAPLTHSNGHLAWGAFAAGLALIFGWLGLNLLLGREAQMRAAASLQAYADQQAESLEFRNQVAALTLRMQRCHTVQEMGATFLSEVRDLIGAEQGVIYVHDTESGELALAAAAACAEVVGTRLVPGEGLLGQVALEQKAQVILTPTEGIWTLRSGLGNTPPQALMLTPLLVQEQLVGVLELATLRQPDSTIQQRFDELARLLADNLEILRRRVDATRKPGQPSLSEEESS